MSEGNYSTNDGERQLRYNSTLLILGISVVLLGCLLALDSLTYRPFGVPAISFWPLIIIGLGIVKLVEHKFHDITGWILTALGTLFLVHTISGYSLKKLIGPAILIVVGVFIVLYALKRQRRVPPELHKSENFTRGIAICSEFRHRPSGGMFEGGEITTIFGSFEMDLRQAAMKSDTVRMDIFMLVGGGKIRVPDGWDVVIRATAIAGDIDDKTIGSPTSDQTRPKLMITGFVLFGSVDVM